MVNYFSDMNPIDVLKTRSGLTLKVNAKDVLKMEKENDTFFLILFSTMVCKIAVVVPKSDQDRYKIEPGKTYHLKNLELNETISSIPVFKTNNRSGFKVSKIEETNTLPFSTEEIQNLKQNIKSNQYKGIPQPTVSQPTSQGQLLNLLEFCKTNPKDLKHDQYVEVQN